MIHNTGQTCYPVSVEAEVLQSGNIRLGIRENERGCQVPILSRMSPLILLTRRMYLPGPGVGSPARRLIASIILSWLVRSNHLSVEAASWDTKRFRSITPERAFIRDLGTGA